MFIIIQNECIDTSIFKKMKLYSYAGIIAFIYKNPRDGAEIELPITFDDTFEADLTFDQICDCYECDEEAYVSEFYAAVPSGLLAKMKRGKDIPTEPFKDYAFGEISRDYESPIKE